MSLPSQSIIPMLAYEDGAAAIDWLTGAFGFRERTRIEENGRIGHAELELNGAIVMLATPTPAYVGPRRHREQCEQARKWSEVPYIIDGVLVYVEDLDAHFQQAKRAGATILSEPEDTEHGIRHYRAEDLEGHRWMFAEEI
jgi:uncharacterized glyoxalase superfamily protein PhnB